MHIARQPQRASRTTTDSRPARQLSPTAPAGAQRVAVAEFAPVGLSAQLLEDNRQEYLLVSSRVEPAQTLLLPTGPGSAPRGLSGYSRMGRWHALYWSLVWGWDAPPEDGVLFTSSALRFRQEARVPARPLGGGWLALAEGLFTVASFGDSSGRDAELRLAPQW